MQNNKNSKWYLGLDIGTDSIGWAVTDVDYKILKFKSNAMWGVMLFDAANQSDERRGFRTARRRLDRRQQRLFLLQELFARELAKKDDKFFVRLKESALFAEDKSTDSVSLFCDKGYTDVDYHRQYPTIHHLISELMKSKKPHDARLVYLACAYILAHRGHFLIDVDKSNIDEVTDFNVVYDQLMSWFDDMEYSRPWDCDRDKFCAVMKKKLGITAKEKEFNALLFAGSKASHEQPSLPVSVKHIIAMLSGKKVKLSDLFMNEEYKELENNTLCLSSADCADIIELLAALLGDDETDLLNRMKALFDWSLLTEMLGGEKYISYAKVKVYEQHKRDLSSLKYIVKKYIPERYNEVFREASDKCNYTRYSYNVKSVKTKLSPKFKKCKSQEDFCKYILSVVKNIDVEQRDKERFDDMMARLALSSFCPKQVNTTNRVIPYQLYWIELKTILDNAAEYLDFLNESDQYGSVRDKIMTLMEFRIPYYVGPLVSRNKSDNVWVVRKSGKIYPWNFDDMVDKDRSEEEFIRRMTCKCTYLAGKDVLPKNSLLYSRFTVLNEINNIKINDVPISVECKQRMFNELFMQRRNVTKAAIERFLGSNGYMKADDLLSGIDLAVKSSLKSYHDFKTLLSAERLSEAEAESIIERITFTEDKRRLKKWLESSFKFTPDELKYVSKLKYSDFGRLSAGLLTEIFDVDLKTGELKNSNIITMLWETNENLMQLLSGKYGYSRKISELNAAYYSEHPSTVMERLDEMYISNAVKRPIIRTLDIVKELRKIMQCEPEKIFIEMARDADNSKKGKRTVSRRDQIIELYKSCDKNEVAELLSRLEGKSDEELRSEKLFLYFTQLGRCMYSGEALDINKIGTDVYNVDHIYPQTRVKDDSLNNKVLVLSTLNGLKSDNYPIAEDIRNKMHGFWESLYNKNLISDVKRKRLERSTGFNNDELAGFISRQLVETRQSTKAVAELLVDICPESDIVYVKAGLVSEFRQKYDMLKCREINDLHHAKDAYLNIVMGNVYNVRFTKNPLNYIKSGAEYTLNLESMLKWDISRGGVTAWKGNGETISRVKAMMNKNNIRYVEYSYRRNGGFYHQNPDRASEDADTLIEMKRGMDVKKYGGYNNSTATYFRAVKYITKQSSGVIIIPIELLYSSKIATDKEFAYEYCKNVTEKLISLKDGDVLTGIEFPLGDRILKVNSVLELDGFRCTIAQKTNKGKSLVISSSNSMICDNKTGNYITALASYAEKSERGRKYQLNEKHSIINRNENIRVFDYICDKLTLRPFCIMFSSMSDKIKAGRPYFEKLSLTEQALVLLNIINILKTGRTAGCDLRLINGKEKAAVMTLNSDLSKLKGYSEIYIVDQSPTGLLEKKSPNLLKL